MKDSSKQNAFESMEDDGGLMGGRWEAEVIWPSGPNEKGRILNIRGPFYDYEDWPEQFRPANYRPASPGNMVISSSSPAND